jgi:hypothetical protein
MMTPEERAAEDAAWEAKRPERIAAHLSSLTDKHITGGITVDGIFIATGTEDRALINGAVTRALLDNDDTKTYPFYPTGGGTVTLTNAQFKAIGQAVANHVQKCLDVAESLDVADYATTEEMEAAYVASLESQAFTGSDTRQGIRGYVDALRVLR